MKLQTLQAKLNCIEVELVEVYKGLYEFTINGVKFEALKLNDEEYRVAYMGHPLKNFTRVMEFANSTGA